MTMCMLEDKFGLLWVGTQNGGLNVFQVIKGEVVSVIQNLTKQPLPSDNIRCLAEDKFGNIWIGTSRGLVVYLRQENKFFSFSNSKFPVSSMSISSLLTDSNDNLWIGSQGAGLYQVDLRQFNTRTISDFVVSPIKNLKDFDISTRGIQSIYEDKDRNIWIGTYGDGIFLMSSVNENFVSIQKRIYSNEAVSYVSFYGMTYDHDGNLWFGTDGNGIYKSDVNGKTLQHFTAENRSSGLTDNAILSALCDSKGRLWFGTYSQGLFRFDKASNAFVHYNYRESFKKSGGNDVRVIFEDSNHNIWVGTNRGGLCIVNETERSYGNPTHFTTAFANGDVRSIAEDKNGNLWIGFYGDGLHRYSLTSQKSQQHLSQTLKSDIINSIKVDRTGNIWLGTGGAGLYQFNPQNNQVKLFTEKEGLANNTIYAVLIDNSDNVWVSNNAGISKLDITANKIVNYTVSDGLQEGQFNPGSALYNRLGGFMCFGGTLGMNLFYPEQVKPNQKKPEVLLSGFSLFNKPVNVNDSIDGESILKQVISKTDEIILNHDQNVITFDFVGLNYSFPENNLYSYKLEGLDEDWNYVGNQRTATYRYLNPGEYTFKVRAADAESVWTSDHASVRLVIRNPFWRTPLAYALYVLSIAAIGFLVYVFQRKQIHLRRRLKIEKNQRKYERQLVQQKLSFFTEISHEFKTPLTLMIGPLEEMLAKESGLTPTGRKLKLVYRNAHKLLNLINKLLDYRKIESGNIVLKVREANLVSFIEEIFISFKELASHKNIKFNFAPAEQEILTWFDKEKLEMVLNNLISNSFKYIGKGDEITITVSRQISEKYPKGRAVIKIRDNGIGIPKKHLGNIFDWFHRGETSGTMSSGIGLSLAKKLVHLHRGEIFVDSVEGSGATFSIKLPLGKNHFKPEELMPDAKGEDLIEALQSSLTVRDGTLQSAIEDEVLNKKGFKSVLIVEDEEEIRQFLREYFEKSYRIFEAANGKEALEVASQVHPDIIISDIMMPEMDGIDFCKAIKNNIRTSHIPIILLTAKSSITHHKEGIGTGADAYITKPFSPEILELTVHNLLQSCENLMRFYRNLFTQENGNARKEGETIDEKFLHSIYKILKDNLDKPDFNVNELCDALNMSRSLVYKKIKTLTGLSPLEYVRSLRLQEAAKLLRTKQYKIFEVVYMVGFTDAKYFRKCFIKEFGFSPSDFIKQAEGIA
jgi:signal transduction histidine kinase/ligand-binding sensor domain-containing protein/DNA-binding response OmpR family regulator